jgi:hypothetical protein
MATLLRFPKYLSLMVCCTIWACGSPNELEDVAQAEATLIATAPKPGWSSVTGYKSATTPVQRNIVASALGKVGGSSGQSSTLDPGGRAASWLTDIAGGDGARMRSAIKIYDAWYRAPTKTKTLAQIQDEMRGSFSGTAYSSASKDLLVQHITSVYPTAGALPTDDEGTLRYLQIRKQCLEWAMTVALQAGGKAKTYGASSVGISNVVPGMGYYNKGSHAMLIVDINWDATGNPVQFKVVESNWPSAGMTKWTNPAGEVPWERVVDARIVTPNSGYLFIDYEK